MGAGDFSVALPPAPTNEPVRDYAPGSPERERLLATLKAMESERHEAPMVIGGNEVRSGDLFEQVLPAPHLTRARRRAPGPDREMSRPRSRPLRRLKQSGRARRGRTVPRSSLAPPTCSPDPGATASTPPPCSGQSKTVHQAEIDAACELIDFWRFNVAYMHRSTANSRSRGPGCGTRWTTGRSRASCSPSAPSTSPRSRATSRAAAP